MLLELPPEPLLTSARLGLFLQPLLMTSQKETAEQNDRELVAVVVFGWLLLEELSEVVIKLHKRENTQGSY